MRTWAKIAMTLVYAALAVNVGTAEGIPDACKLLSHAEIQSAFGVTATGFEHATTFRDGSTSICQGSVGGATVTLRVSIESEQDSANERTIGQMMSGSGGEVDTVTTGAVTCTTMVPPQSMVEYGFDSMCKISQGGREVAVQASTRDRKAIVPVTALRQLVTLAGSRFGRDGH
jgi:hypothetical protein